MLLAGCQSTSRAVESAASRAVEPRATRTETNFSFTIEKNLLRLHTVTVDGRAGRFFLGSAHPRTLLSPAFRGGETARRAQVQLTNRESVSVEPITHDLGGIGEGIVGFDAWASQAISVNYVEGLVTFQKDGIHTDYMTVFGFEDEPTISISVNGETITAAVDTAIPDTLLLPRGTTAAGRTKARVEIAGAVFNDADIALADVSRARIGNRLLSKFLVSIDYGRRQVGLWRDPRTPASP